eukprot:9493399-Pyramimonas_sp.AAC.1
MTPRQQTIPPCQRVGVASIGQVHATGAHLMVLRRVEVVALPLVVMHPHQPPHGPALVAGTRTTWTNQTQEVQVYSHNGPIRHIKCRYILTRDQSDTGSHTPSKPRRNVTKREQTTHAYATTTSTACSSTPAENSQPSKFGGLAPPLDPL